MATLQQIGTQGLVGTAPTPVLSHAINHYLVNDALMNIMRFTNDAMKNNLGNFQISGVYYEGTSEATFRALGVNYTPDNEKPLTFTETLKPLGGAFESDIEIARAFGKDAGAVANWEEQQIAQKLNAITNGFAKWFIQGDSSKDSKQFDGLNKKISADQVISTPIDVSDLDHNKASKVEVALNKVIAKVQPKRPNAIITTAMGKAYLSSINTFKNRAIDEVAVNSLKYSMYIDIPIIALTDSCFPAEDTKIGIPVIFMYVNELDGVRVSVPLDGQVVIIVPPKFDNGKAVEQGLCEMLSVPLFVNPFAVAKCYLTDTPASDTGKSGV